MPEESLLCSGVGLSLSPASSSSAGIPTPLSFGGSRAVNLTRSLLRAALPFPCQALGAAARSPRGQGW